jgi:DNA repair protein RecN (Recombination protein N)
MLEELCIRNFAIIEDLSIRFNDGLTILSGETGAGKSIIINAVNLLLGSRASATLIRTGSDNAELEALFKIPEGSRVAAVMADLGYESDQGLMVRRIISRRDRHRIYINNRMATMQALISITTHLASISGQHAHQGLLKEDEHLLILDQFGLLLALRDQFRTCYNQIVPLISKEKELLRKQSRQAEQLELLNFQLTEIDAAQLVPDEDQKLENDRTRLKNAETLLQTVQQCIGLLYSNEGAVVEKLGYIGRSLARAGDIDAQLISIGREIDSLAYGAEDLADRLRSYLGRIDLDPQQIDAVEDRLDTLNKLKRKYGGTIEAVLDHAEKAKGQLAQIENIDTELEKVHESLDKQHDQLNRLAQDLSRRRQKAARTLARKVELELSELKMDGTQFAVDLQYLPTDKETNPYLISKQNLITESGLDRAVFMIAPNVGETIKPLSAIASGGELSRLVLALKAILAQTESVETVVFDEVDAGISGNVAEMVGRKLAALARHHQILCITHLPQIAKFGNHHFRISKTVDKGRTSTTISNLSADERVEEVARMLGGEQITGTTIAHAKELLDDTAVN